MRDLTILMCRVTNTSGLLQDIVDLNQKPCVGLNRRAYPLLGWLEITCISCIEVTDLENIRGITHWSLLFSSEVSLWHLTGFTGWSQILDQDLITHFSSSRSKTRNLTSLAKVSISCIYSLLGRWWIQEEFRFWNRPMKIIAWHIGWGCVCLAALMQPLQPFPRYLSTQVAFSVFPRAFILCPKWLCLALLNFI